MRRDTFPEIPGRHWPPSATCPSRPKRLRLPSDDDPANPGGGWGHHRSRPWARNRRDMRVAASRCRGRQQGRTPPGAIGLAQFVNASKGDPNALMVMGAVMLGGVITSKPPWVWTRSRLWHA